MALITLLEAFYLLVLVAVVAYVFSGMMPIHRKKVNLGMFKIKRFDWEEFKFSAIVAAPGIVLHELSHKFVAMAFGLTAQFQIWAPGVILAVVLKAVNSPFILIAPGYVNILGKATQLQLVLISAAGPAVNLIFWLGCGYILTHLPIRNRITAIGLYITKEINKLLFIFNMIPIPPLDGSKILFGLFSLLFH